MAFWSRKKDAAVVPTSRVCPNCNVAGPKRLAPGQVCATCEAQRAWNAIGESGIKIDVKTIDEAVRRREGEAAGEPLWKKALAYAPVLFSFCVAAATVWSLYMLLRPREIGPLQALFDDLKSTNRHALWFGIGTFIVGVVMLWRTRGNRSYRNPVVLVSHLLAIVAGVGAIAIAGFHMYAVGGFGGKFNSMPKRDSVSLGVTTGNIDRIINATTIVLAPGADGDARQLAMGTGAIIHSDATNAWIVTCSHVAMPYAAVGTWRHAKDAQPVWVQLSDGREGKGRVSWAAPPPLDIAVIDLPIANAPAPIPIAPNAGQLDPNAPVTFVPNPYRDGWLVHHGHLLRKEAHDTPAGRYELLITDLPVTHGDSGSGLFDERGQLVGLNTWTKLEDGFSHGISLPSEAMRALSDAVEHEDFNRLDDMLKDK